MMKTAHRSKNAFRILRLSNPAFAFLELTYACGGTCPGCPSVSLPALSEMMTGSQWGGIVKELAQFLAESRLTGGEPSLHPEFLSILQALEKEGLPFKIYTSGLWPEPGKMLKMLKKSSFFRGFVFSLHGSNASTHRFFTGLEAFDEIITSIKSAVRSRLPVYTSTVLGEYNHGDLPGIMKLVAMLGSRRHYFRRYTGPVRRGISMCREHLGRALEAVEKIPSGIFSYRLGECYPRCFYAGSSPCLAGITHITINPLGFIRACPFSDEVLGKWNSGRRKPFSCASSLAEWASDFPESCMRCSEVVSCMGGCRVARRSLRCTRDPLMEGPLQKREGPGGALPGKSLLLSGFIKFCGTVRREKFGFLLMSEDEVVPVTKSGGEVLSLCDGTREIGEIERIAGSRAKDFIVSLGRRGFIDLVIEGDRPQSGRGQ